MTYPWRSRAAEIGEESASLQLFSANPEAYDE
jgi:hypothetical protein